MVDDELGRCYVVYDNHAVIGGNVVFNCLTDLKDRFVLDMCACFFKEGVSGFEFIKKNDYVKNVMSWLYRVNQSLLVHGKFLQMPSTVTDFSKQQIIQSLDSFIKFYRLFMRVSDRQPPHHLASTCEQLSSSMAIESLIDDIIAMPDNVGSQQSTMFMLISYCIDSIDHMAELHMDAWISVIEDIGCYRIAKICRDLNDRKAIETKRLYWRIQSFDLYATASQVFCRHVERLFLRNLVFEKKKAKLVHCPEKETLVMAGKGYVLTVNSAKKCLLYATDNARYHLEAPWVVIGNEQNPTSLIYKKVKELLVMLPPECLDNTLSIMEEKEIFTMIQHMDPKVYHTKALI